MIVPCPHCGAPYDTSNRLSGDAVYCPHCSRRSTVRHQNGGQTTLAQRAEPPVNPERSALRARDHPHRR
jgi:sarcosine oxidase delta subunit